MTDKTKKMQKRSKCNKGPFFRPRLAITSDHHHLHHANTSSAYESQQQQRLTLMQKRLEEKVAENIKYYELDPSATENTNIR